MLRELRVLDEVLEKKVHKPSNLSILDQVLEEKVLKPSNLRILGYVGRCDAADDIGPGSIWR